MTNPTHGSLRVTRAAVFGAVAFALSWAAHVAAGGSSPGGGALVLLGVLTALGATLVTGWRLGPAPLVAALAAAQVALHESLMWLGSSSPSPCGSMTCDAAMPGMTMHPAAPSSAWMLAAHGAATVVLALALSVGERALWFLATLLWPVLRGRPELAGVPAPTRVPAHEYSAPARTLPFASGGTGRRGPPRRHVTLAV